VQRHPDLAAAFAEIEPDETPPARIKRFAALTRRHTDDPETRMLLAELHIAAEDFPEARRALGDLVETDPTTRSVTIRAAIERGELHALGITASGYTSARSVTFYQGHASVSPWSRVRRDGRPASLAVDHLMASAAVPFVFPPVHIGGEYFGDGAMRQSRPLSPAIHLGAERLLVIGVRNEVPDEVPSLTQAAEFPSFGQIGGYMLDTLFMDGLYSDLERISRINDLLDAVPNEQVVVGERRLRPIDTMLIVPSEDLRVIAEKHRRELPFAIRTLLRGVGGNSPGENKLLSFLLFESAYTRELIHLGYRDAMAVKDQLLDFVTGKSVPRLYAPAWIKRDLSSLSPD